MVKGIHLSSFDGFPYHRHDLICSSFGLQFWGGIACVAGVSVRFRSKERGMRVKDRANNGASKRAGRGGKKERKETKSRGFICKSFLPSPPSPPSFIFWVSFHFSRGQNRKSPFSVFLCCETRRKRLLRRQEVGKAVPVTNALQS